MFIFDVFSVCGTESWLKLKMRKKDEHAERNHACET